MKSTEIYSQNVTILFNILGSNWESDPYSQQEQTCLQWVVLCPGPMVDLDD